MKIEVNIEKSQFYIFLVVIFISAGFLIVNAYGTTAPATFGHSAGEIEEVDPTVLDSVKNGVDWSEVTLKPAGFEDGVDDVGDTQSCAMCSSCGGEWPTYMGSVYSYYQPDGHGSACAGSYPTGGRWINLCCK